MPAFESVSQIHFVWPFLLPEDETLLRYFALFICVGLVPLSTLALPVLSTVLTLFRIRSTALLSIEISDVLTSFTIMAVHVAPQTDREPPSIIALFLGGLPQGGGTWNRLGQ